MSTTISLKRKRDSLESQQPTTNCFTNSAFSSTPNKLVIPRRQKLQKAKENVNPFMQNTCLEVKSIADIVLEAQCEKQKQLKEQVQEIPKNPYEVERKPPKKKKRQTECEDACFENPALNLELPEKQFNPYELVREASNAAAAIEASKCFFNEALNIRAKDAELRNPFEIQRCNAEPKTTPVAPAAGVENLGLEAIPTSLKIGLPFTPTLGCRIDFKNMSLSQLTPSKLLAEKLVFSPVPQPKRSLDSISEESSVDIGKELDRYQLELENSINEARLRKNGGDATEAEDFTVQVEQKITFTQRLAEISEAEEKELEESIVACTEIQQETNIEAQIEQKCSHQNVAADTKAEGSISQADHHLDMDKSITCAVVYASDSDEEDLDFKAPAPFVRAYRTADGPKRTDSKESLKSNKSTKSGDSAEHKTKNIKNLIRRSIRKLMYPTQATATNCKELQAEPEPHIQHNNILSSIRKSLRRKPVRPTPAAEPLVSADISIIDASERTMKLKTVTLQTEYVNIEQLTNERKHSLRHSIRRSTQDMLKSVFHKSQEEYALHK